MIEPTKGVLHFPPFSLDLATAELRRTGTLVRLRPKTAEVLRFLAVHPGRLVTRAEIVRAVWRDTHVSEGLLKVCVSELRSALEDDAVNPRYVATVHRKGYRFVADLTTSAEAASSLLVGRDRELATLGERLERALSGERQIVFVSGDAGIGKTALVEGFLARRLERILIARGQCVEQYGTGEGFLPVLEALGRVCRDQGRDGPLATCLRDQAPSWLLEMPGLLDAAEHRRLSRLYSGVARSKMLRELVVGFETLTDETPLALVLEDLQWSDPSTLDLVRALARRTEPMRMLVVLTTRTVDPVASEIPVGSLLRDLVGRRLASEVALEPLGERDVASYLGRRFAILEPTLAARVHRQTGGHPLFLVTVADDLAGAADRVDADAALPASLERLIESRIQRATADERGILDAAALCGEPFTTAEVAAALDASAIDVEALCRSLAQPGGLLRSSGSREWPDETTSGVYSFVHALYREWLDPRIDPRTRARLHRRIGERLETGYAREIDPVTSSLAVHFDRGGDLPRAIRYRLAAGKLAARRHAYAEAIGHLERGLALLRNGSELPDRDRIELDLLVALGVPLVNTKGFGAPEVERAYRRALDVCRKAGEAPELFSVLDGLHGFFIIRGELGRGYDLAKQMHRIAEQERNPTLLVESNHVIGCTQLRFGELDEARRHLEAAIALGDDDRAADTIPFSGHDARVCCLANLALVDWLAGRPDAAANRARAAIELAERISHPLSLALALVSVAWFQVLARDPDAARETAERAASLSRSHGFPYWGAIAALILRPLGATERDGRIEGFRAASDRMAAMGPGIAGMESLVMLAAACRSPERAAEGRSALDRALERVRKHGERFLESEIHRLRGDLVLVGDGTDRARAARHYRRAIAVAESQGASLLELRAAARLARVSTTRASRERLERLLSTFPATLEARDLTEAREILARSAAA